MATGNKVVTGARAQLWANGQMVGVATGVDVTDNIRQTPIVVLDKLDPDGFATVGTEVSVRVSRLKIPGNSMVALGLWPSVDIDETVRKNILLDFPEITFRVKDSKTGQTITTVKGAVPSQKQMRYQAGQLVAEDVTFPAIVCGDEHSPTF